MGCGTPWSRPGTPARTWRRNSELVAAIAQQVADLVWTVPEVDPDTDESTNPSRLSDDQRGAVLRLADALPEPWRSRLTTLLNEGGEDGSTGVLVPA